MAIQNKPGMARQATPMLWDASTSQRPAGAYAYIYRFDDNGAGIMSGGAAQKTYFMYLNAARLSAATGDSNDAMLRINFNNYAANDSNFIMRGLNISIANRSGGTLGQLIGGSIGSQQKSGGTCPTICGLTVTPENYGTCATEFGGIDIILKNEGAQATTSYGIRVRSTEASGMAAIGAAVHVSNTSTNGFTYILDCTSVTALSAAFRFPQIASVVSATGQTSGTQAGCIKVVMGSTPLFIPTYPTFTP